MHTKLLPKKVIANANGSYYIVVHGSPLTTQPPKAQGRHSMHKERIVVVCLCHRISDRDIARAAREGCPDYDTLQEELRVGTSCGSCDDCARSVFAACSCAAGARSSAPADAQLAFA